MLGSISTHHFPVKWKQYAKVLIPSLTRVMFLDEVGRHLNNYLGIFGDILKVFLNNLNLYQKCLYQIISIHPYLTKYIPIF